MSIKRYSVDIWSQDDENGEYVSYTDHASEVSALQEENSKAFGELETVIVQLRGARDEAVRQSMVVVDKNTSLRAQLEAAKQNYSAALTRNLQDEQTIAQLTAQPSGVREAIKLAMQALSIHLHGKTYIEGKEPLAVKAYMALQALAAPAPACKTCGGSKWATPKANGAIDMGIVSGDPRPCPDCNAGEGEK